VDFYFLLFQTNPVFNFADFEVFMIVYLDHVKNLVAFLKA